MTKDHKGWESKSGKRAFKTREAAWKFWQAMGKAGFTSVKLETLPDNSFQVSWSGFSHKYGPKRKGYKN